MTTYIDAVRCSHCAPNAQSLTNEAIRKNWEEFGHPDGRQEVSTGIALPSWIVESKNNIWVLGVYGIVFGGALPMLVVSLLPCPAVYGS